MRSAKQPECVYVSVTLTTLASLAARDGAKLRHVLQDTANNPPTTRNYLCGRLSRPSVSKLVCCTVTLTKLLALLSHPTEQRADRAAAHPPPEITFAVSQAARVSQSAHPPMRKAAAFLTLANARRWRAYSYLVGNACVLYGNAYQAASPALTAFGAESRPRSSPPTTLKLAFLYGNAFLQQISTAARFLCASYACP